MQTTGRHQAAIVSIGARDKGTSPEHVYQCLPSVTTTLARQIRGACYRLPEESGAWHSVAGACLLVYERAICFEVPFTAPTAHTVHVWESDYGLTVLR